MNFVDFKKAFDSVHRESLWSMLGLYGVPNKFVKAFKGLYSHSECSVRTEDGETEFFEIETGVRQGCILSPILFLIALDFVMRKATKGYSCGLTWNTEQTLCDLDFADDLALIGKLETGELQALTNRLVEYAAMIGLRINVKKTKVLHVGEQEDKLMADGVELKVVNRFSYLGSMVRGDGKVQDDVRIRCGLGYDVSKICAQSGAARKLA